MSSIILGISAFYHDSAAALIEDGKIIGAIQEERFTRKKHDPAFPINSIKYLLEERGIELSQLDSIVFYDKPFLKFERLLETYATFSPKGLKSFLRSMPVWIKEKLFLKSVLRDEFKKISKDVPKLYFPEHHLSHAASAFYPSPYNDAAVLTVDGVGEWATTTICKGTGKDLTVMRELHFPHSVGLLYSAFTYFCGFKVNSGEYKLMGLAPYGNPDAEQTKTFKKKILEELIDLRDDGSLLLNMDYFEYATGDKMCDDKRWEALFGLKKKEAETDIDQEYMNLAYACQEVTEEIVFRLAKTARELTGCKNLVMAGGVALNCVANGKLVREGIFENVWVQPAAGDAGGALGAALAAHHIINGAERTADDKNDSMYGSYLGSEFSDQDVERMIKRYEAVGEKPENFENLCDVVTTHVERGDAIGWFQGRMEFGPRALGNRTILGDPRSPEMQKKLNLKIKYRESFRPFAPAVLEEDIKEYFEFPDESPYMLMVAPVNQKRRNDPPANYNGLSIMDRLYFNRSDIPAITHVDFSARIQSVSKKTNFRFWTLINKFKEKTGCGVLVNTSFNVRGEPIVRSPEDAYRCFMRTEMDMLVVGNYIFKKNEQPNFTDKANWKEEFVLD